MLMLRSRESASTISPVGGSPRPLMASGGASRSRWRWRRRRQCCRSTSLSAVCRSVSGGEGRRLGLLGRNGAGKTTSMNVVTGVLPPRRGRVEIFGTPVAGRSPEAIAAQGVALVPQGRRIFRSLTVRENLAVAARKPRGGLPLLWTLDTVFAGFPRLQERRDQYAGTLSGGEQQ